MGKSLLMIKPDAVERHLVGEIIGRLEKARIYPSELRMLKISYDEAMKFYAVHHGKPFLEELCKFMSSGPVVAMVLESEGDTIAKVRELIGATNPKNAAAGTIRHDLALNVTKNSVHASDSPENAEKEIAFFFS